MRVIFVSGGYKAGIRERALASGAVAFLHKPFDTGLVLEIVHAVLESDGPSEP